MSDIHEFLAVNTREERCTWLGQHLPARDDAFVAALRDEARRRSSDDPHTVLAVAIALADLAACWETPNLAAAALHVEADARMLFDEHAAALSLYEQAASQYHALGLDLEAARVGVGQMGALVMTGQIETALALSQQTGATLAAAGDQRAAAVVTMNQGNLFAQLGRFAEAEAQYAQARQVFAELGEAQSLAMTTVNHAITLTFLDDFSQAETLYQQARAYFVEQAMQNAVGQVDLNLAYLCHAQGNYQQALALLNGAYQVFAELATPTEMARVDLHRSDTYLALNLWQEALNHACAARQVFEQAGMPWEAALAWLNEAAARAHHDPAHPPLAALRAAREAFAHDENTLWMAVADLYEAIFLQRAGNSADAHRAAELAAAVFRQAGLRSRTAQCEVVLGELALSQNDLAQAAQHFDQGLATLETAPLPAIAYACHYGLGRVAQQQRDPAQARRHYRAAIDDIERLQSAIGAEDYKIAFLGDKLRVYEALTLLCLEIDTPESREEAFETIERAKSRALLDALARKRPAPDAPAGDLPADRSASAADLREQLDRLKRELNWYYNQLNEPQPDSDKRSPARLAALTQAIVEREKQLTQLLSLWQSPDLISAPANPIWTVTVPQIQAALPPETTLVEFYMAHGEIIVFGLTQKQMWTRRLAAGDAEIAEGIHQFRFQINKFGYGKTYRQRHADSLQRSVNDTLNHLYQVLWAPIADQVLTDAVVIIPHGRLHYVPFHALFDGQTYLVDHHTLSYAPSATVLHRVLTTPPVATDMPPTIAGIRDAGIPFAETEVRAIAQLFPEANLFFGERATTDRLMAPTRPPAFLHLSTHAMFRADNPLFSALKLTDGWLSVNDIYTMPASPRLVTLSACETGRTQVADGDELVGLCRGFFSAGAQSLVVSQWVVDDNSTAQLMTHFYTALLAGASINQALRSAQIALKATQPHPYYWAPFILTGSIHTHLQRTASD